MAALEQVRLQLLLRQRLVSGRPQRPRSRRLRKRPLSEPRPPTGGRRRLYLQPCTCCRRNVASEVETIGRCHPIAGLGRQWGVELVVSLDGVCLQLGGVTCLLELLVTGEVPVSPAARVFRVLDCRPLQELLDVGATQTERSPVDPKPVVSCANDELHANILGKIFGGNRPKLSRITAVRRPKSCGSRPLSCERRPAD